MQLRGRPVLAGVVENVTEVRAWAHWHAWATQQVHALQRASSAVEGRNGALA